MYRIMLIATVIATSFQLYSTDANEYDVSFGLEALSSLEHGDHNTAMGAYSLTALKTGDGNTALGSFAGSQLSEASDCIFIGFYAGQNMSGKPKNVILIGNFGDENDSCTIRIGDNQCRCFIAGIHGSQIPDQEVLPVVINASGQLGTSTSLLKRIRDQDLIIEKLQEQIIELSQKIDALVSR